MSGEAPRALVTGATGFIGSHLVRRLLDAGWETHVVLRKPGRSDEGHGRARAYVHDGSTVDLVRIVSASKPTVVFHLASLFLTQHQAPDVERLIASNVLFSTELAEAMVANGVKSLVNTGTSWQHYEGADYNPVNLYAASKEAFEVIARYYSEAYGLRMITLKLFDTYGPSDLRGKLIGLLLAAARDERTLSMSLGEQYIDLVHVDDVVDAYLVAAERLISGLVEKEECYGISSGEALRLRDLVDLVEKVSGKSISIDWGARPYRPREVMEPWSGYQVLPGWAPRIPLPVGLQGLWQEQAKT